MNKLLKQFLSFSIGSWITIIMAIITTPYVTRIISPEEFGKYNIFVLYCSIFMCLLTLGLDQSFIRFYYKEKTEARYLLLRKTLMIPLMVLIIVLILSYPFRTEIFKYIFGEYNLYIYILFILNSLVMLINRFMMLALRMKQKGKVYSLITVAQKVMYIANIIIFYKGIGDNRYVLIMAIVIANLTVMILNLVKERYLWIELFKKANSDSTRVKSKSRELILYGMPLLFNYIITLLFQSADKMAIQRYSGFNEVGIYSAAYSIVSLMNIIQSSFNVFWSPTAYKHYESNKDDKSFFYNVNEVVCALMFMLAITIIAFKDIIAYFLGGSYRQAIIVVPFLIFMPVFYTISETTSIGIGFMKKPKYHLYVSLTACLVNIIGNLILVPSIGFLGASISTAFSYFLYFILRTIFSERLYKIGFPIYKIVIISFVILVYGIIVLIDIPNVIKFSIYVGIMCILFKIYGKTLSKVVRSTLNI